MTASETAHLVAEALDRLLGFARQEGVKVMIPLGDGFVDLATYGVHEVTTTPGALKLDVEVYGKASESLTLTRHAERSGS